MYATLDSAEEYEEYVGKGKCVLFFTKGTAEMLHHLVFKAYPLMAHLDYLGTSRYAVVYGGAYEQMSKTQNIAAPIGVALFDETNVACSFATFDKRVLCDYIELLFGDPTGQHQPTIIRQSTTLVDMSHGVEGPCGKQNYKDASAVPMNDVQPPMSRTATDVEQNRLLPPSLAKTGRSLSARLFPRMIRRNTSR
ncbi:hypothetical protein GGI23_002933 [Coemansia sp. RSA 2559]|nr:hypothetical protein GGI23_002933 [Coemansia sp. RSA 2559]